MRRLADHISDPVGFTAREDCVACSRHRTSQRITLWIEPYSVVAIRSSNGLTHSFVGYVSVTARSADGQGNRNTLYSLNFRLCSGASVRFPLCLKKAHSLQPCGVVRDSTTIWSAGSFPACQIILIERPQHYQSESKCDELSATSSFPVTKGQPPYLLPAIIS